MAGSKRKLSILFITSEIYPLIKTGGLADVSAALPQALQDLGIDIRVLVPGYPSILAAIKKQSPVITLTILGQEVRVLSARVPQLNFPLYVVVAEIFDRDGNPYLGPNDKEWPDSALRFGLLCHVGAWISSYPNSFSWQPDVVHCNDWQAGLVPALLHYSGTAHAASVMTIHNLSFQGVFPAAQTTALGLPKKSFHMEGVEFHDQLSFLKAGIYFADQITTVSPSYAEEIQSRAYGCGMQGLLSARQDHLKGILNGIDTAAWDPQRDPFLATPYSATSLPDKLKNKTALQTELGLNISDGMLFGVVSRLTQQKGLDLVVDVAAQIIKRGGQLAVLGSGDTILQQQFQALAKANPKVIQVASGYDERLAHLIEAGADCFLMPSRFEPCGLNQMYSMRYGTPPIVRATGGLNDTVTDANPRAIENGSATGFTFNESTSSALWLAIERAFVVFANKTLWQQLQINGMDRDFSWRRSAEEYLVLYKNLQRTNASAYAK